MKKKIAILGSTGSIGMSTLDVIRNDIKNFEIVLLMSNKNINKLLSQAIEFNVKNLVVTNKDKFNKILKTFSNKKINIYNNIEDFYKNNKKKIDYTMSAISGLDGLKPTLTAINFSKIIAIANKESLICAWSLIQKKLIEKKTTFIPVDSEHFSIFSLLDNYSNHEIDEIIITASGGPFLKYPLNKFKNIKPSEAIKHPNWSMGQKISIDSATMMNKVFEVIEAQKIFNIDIKKFRVLIHPASYVHAIVKFKNGIIKILIHETDMKIPIFNSIYGHKGKYHNLKKINFDILNNLDFQKVNLKKFPVMKLLKKIPNKDSLFETILVSANDELVNLFLNNKIKFTDIHEKLYKVITSKDLKKYINIRPQTATEISNLDKYVRLKTRSYSV